MGITRGIRTCQRTIIMVAAAISVTLVTACATPPESGTNPSVSRSEVPAAQEGSDVNQTSTSNPSGAPEVWARQDALGEAAAHIMNTVASTDRDFGSTAIDPGEANEVVVYRTSGDPDPKLQAAYQGAAGPSTQLRFESAMLSAIEVKTIRAWVNSNLTTLTTAKWRPAVWGLESSGGAFVIRYIGENPEVEWRKVLQAAKLNVPTLAIRFAETDGAALGG